MNAEGPDRWAVGVFELPWPAEAGDTGFELVRGPNTLSHAPERRSPGLAPVLTCSGAGGPAAPELGWKRMDETRTESTAPALGRPVPGLSPLAYRHATTHRS
ncbi:hypothetical protein GCM10010495_15220 [Kitasatospora herbaricolor]|nr:hypothetical protein GCM10010495_15220 [Kitasatospora herbaricolor]